jgi:hypothetical protein
MSSASAIDSSFLLDYLPMSGGSTGLARDFSRNERQHFTQGESYVMPTKRPFASDQQLKGELE